MQALASQSAQLYCRHERCLTGKVYRHASSLIRHEHKPHSCTIVCGCCKLANKENICPAPYNPPTTAVNRPYKNSNACSCRHEQCPATFASRRSRLEHEEEHHKTCTSACT